MFKTAGVQDDPALTFTFEGRQIQAALGASIASALLADGETTFRSTPISGTNRGPFCMMGVCFDCLVEVDGVSNKQACMVPVENGMRVRRQCGAGTTQR